MTFEEWLARENYRTSTAKKTVSGLERLRGRFYAQPPADRSRTPLETIVPSRNDLSLLQRYKGYLQAIGSNNDHFDAWVSRQELGQRKKLRAKTSRQTPARSFPEAEWKQLVAVLRRDTSPEGTVLYLQAVTGARIGDVLRLTRRELIRGLRTGILRLERKGGTYVEVPVEGSISAPWEALRDRWRGGETVAAWVCPTSELGDEAAGGAYQRVRRHFRQLGTQLGLSGRLNLHRLRRTVGVRALTATKDIHAVSQLLGHRSLQSTERYVDELRTSEVAALQRKLLES